MFDRCCFRPPEPNKSNLIDPASYANGRERISKVLWIGCPVSLFRPLTIFLPQTQGAAELPLQFHSPTELLLHYLPNPARIHVQTRLLVPPMSTLSGFQLVSETRKKQSKRDEVGLLRRCYCFVFFSVVSHVFFHAFS